MLGCTGTGCFFVGVVLGFILAGLLGLVIFFGFNPDARESAFSAVRQVWTAVKGGVDNTLDATAKPGAKPPVEPQVPQGRPVSKEGPAPVPAPRPAAPPESPARSKEPPLPRARIEINL